MLNVLRHPVYLRLFSAQAIALLGTGLMTIALGLLAFELAGESAGAVLGTAYAIKMVAYVGFSPVASALVAHLPRKAVLIAADLLRAATAVFLPFITEVWQIYLLIFVLQLASATFTPAFQATIPDVLRKEEDYTRALSLSRLLYDLENLISPALAGLLLTIMGFHWLFGGTVVGFLVSALLVLGAAIPAAAPSKKDRGFRDRLTRGSRIYLATPRLRGLLALTLVGAASSAFVIVNTVVLVRAGFGFGDGQVAYALAAYGGGSMLVALSLPWLLARMSERSVMIAAGVLLAAVTLGQGVYMVVVGLFSWSVLLGLWALMGGLYSAVLTPAGRLLRNSAHANDRPALFAAQFALSHVCWLATYPIAGWVGQAFGLGVAMLLLGSVAVFGAGLALVVWRRESGEILAHGHPELPTDHPHLKGHGAQPGQHRHAFVIDDEHRRWPTNG